jgi:AmmeMemoRadiSam system protein B
LGIVPVDAALKELLCEQIAELKVDDQAHLLEHSLEVMLPFLYRQRPDVRIVPIALRSLAYDQAAHLGRSIAAVIQQQHEEVLLLASSDMNHFLDAETTESLDFMAISAMTNLDPQGLYQTVLRNRISMCGMLPAVVAMNAAKALGAAECQLVRYAHSGQVNGDNSRVVGYASLSMN